MGLFDALGKSLGVDKRLHAIAITDGSERFRQLSVAWLSYEHVEADLREWCMRIFAQELREEQAIGRMPAASYVGDAVTDGDGRWAIRIPLYIHKRDTNGKEVDGPIWVVAICEEDLQNAS